MKKTIGIIISIFLLINLIAAPVPGGENYEAPLLYADSAVLINGNSGEILYDKNRMKEEFPASTTKIMTALVVLSNMKLDQKVTISKNAVNVEGANIKLVEGEVLTVEDLLYAMLVNSANDAAIALAEATAGDIDSFAWMMNKKADYLGGTSTYFLTPNGLPNEAHVTSAYDLALYTKEAMKNKTFRKIVSTVHYTIHATNKSPERKLENTNRLLFDKTEVNINGQFRPIFYEGAIGVKTGYTNAAQGCLVAAVKKDDTYLIGVVMHSPREKLYQDMVTLLNFGEHGYKTVSVVKAGKSVGKTKVRRGKKHAVDVVTQDDVTVSIEMGANGQAEDYSAYSYKVSTTSISAPKKAGTKCGTLILLHNDQEVGHYSLVTKDDVELSSIYSIMDFNAGVKVVLAVGLGLILLFFILYRIGAAYMKRLDKRERAELRRLRREREKYFESHHLDPKSGDDMDHSDTLSVNVLPDGMMDEESFLVFDDSVRNGTEARKHSIENSKDRLDAEKAMRKAAGTSESSESEDPIAKAARQAGIKKPQISKPEEIVAAIIRKFSKNNSDDKTEFPYPDPKVGKNSDITVASPKKTYKNKSTDNKKSSTSGMGKK